MSSSVDMDVVLPFFVRFLFFLWPFFFFLPFALFPTDVVPFAVFFRFLLLGFLLESLDIQKLASPKAGDCKICLLSVDICPDATRPGKEETATRLLINNALGIFVCLPAIVK